MNAERTDPAEVERRQLRSDPLPLEASPKRDGDTWSITRPVRAETVEVLRETVTVEEIVVTTHFVEEPPSVPSLSRKRETLEVDGEAREAAP